RSTPVRLLAVLLQVSADTNDGQDTIDSVLNAAWNDARGLLHLTASGYILPLQELAFSPLTSAFVCPVTRRFLDTTLRGMTPYIPRILRQEISTCSKVSIPIYDAPFGDTTDNKERIKKARAWLASQAGLQELRDEGLWSNLNDRVIELSPYFAAA